MSDKTAWSRRPETTASSDTTRENYSDNLRPYKEWDPLLNVPETSAKIRTHASVYSARVCHWPLGNDGVVVAAPRGPPLLFLNCVPGVALVRRVSLVLC